MKYPRYDEGGPFIMWLNYGYDGWAPHSYDTLKDALEGDRHGEEFVITQLVQYDLHAKERCL